jgi:hypothetical protein
MDEYLNGFGGSLFDGQTNLEDLHRISRSARDERWQKTAGARDHD